ncbi:hypothetical protein GXW82_07110 [Streptacidiphilus sp. 4-A2]|nr:hypothetical protein [Streptacidiphilus sp. 4-A2]
MSNATTATAHGGRAPAPAVRARTDRSKLIGGLAQAAIGAYGLWEFGLGSRTAHGVPHPVRVKLDPSATGGPHPISAPAQPVALALTAVAIVCGLVRAFAPITAKAQRWLAFGYFVSFVLAFLVWAAAGSGIGLNVPSIIPDRDGRGAAGAGLAQRAAVRALRCGQHRRRGAVCSARSRPR